LCQGTDLGTVLLIGGGEKPRQQVAQGIDRGMYLTAFASFGSIIARSTPTFGRRLQSATIKDGRCRLPLASLCFAQEQAQIIHQGSKTASGQPSALVC
jgi:hypothetical protein